MNRWKNTSDAIPQLQMMYIYETCEIKSYMT